MDNGQWTVDDCITVHPSPESCTGINSNLASGSLLTGQPRTFGPSRQCKLATDKTIVVSSGARHSDYYREMAHRNWGNPAAHVYIAFGSFRVSSLRTSVKICQMASSLRNANFSRSR
jgi:hypothetical protein